MSAPQSTRLTRSALRSRRPDVVLSDVVLPGISGVELLRWLKRHDEALPVVMMTAHGNIDAAVEAMKSGARYHILYIRIENSRVGSSILPWPFKQVVNYERLRA